MKSKIIIVDNDLIFRQSLIFLISIQDNAEVIGKASNGDELMELLTNLRPDLILIDIDIPQMNACEVIQRVLKTNPGINIIALSMYQNEDHINNMIKMGVKGFYLKSKAILDLKNEIHSLLRSEKFYISIPLVDSIKKLIPQIPQFSVENGWIKNGINNQTSPKKWSYSEQHN